MSNGTKITTPRHENFSIVSNVFLRDKNLSLKAKGLMAFMLSLPPEWDYSIVGLIKVTGAGKDAIQTCLRELREKGYLIMNQNKDKAGRFGSVEYILIEDPSEDYPCAEKSDAGNTHAGNPPQINTKGINTDENKKRSMRERAYTRFSPPTVDEVRAYCKEKGYNIDPVQFVNYFEANDWTDSKGNKVKSWKQKVITWSSYRKEQPSQPEEKPVVKDEKKSAERRAQYELVMQEIRAQQERDLAAALKKE